jgi:hypothetical protein
LTKLLDPDIIGLVLKELNRTLKTKKEKRKGKKMTLVWLQLKQFVKFSSESLDPDEDPLIQWMINLEFWNSRVRDCVVKTYRAKEASCYLPLYLETQFRQKFKLPFGRDTQKLFSRLLSSSTGIPLCTLGFNDCGWEDTETCTGKILALQLGRVQDRARFKAVNIAFDTRAQFLIGSRSVPYA